MRRQIGKASVLIDTEVVEHPAATDNFRLPDRIVGRRFDLHSHDVALSGGKQSQYPYGEVDIEVGRK
jgi:hypothetical protein